MSPNAWSLDADPNALSMDGCAYASGGKAMALHVANTSDVSPYAVGQVLIASAAWGCKNEDGTLLSRAYLLVAEMVVSTRANVVHLWASEASLNETFASTSIQFASNNLANKMGPATVVSSGRRLDSHVFYNYLPPTECSTICGAYKLDKSHCYGYASDSAVDEDCPGLQYKMFEYAGGKTKACGYIYDCLAGPSAANLTFNMPPSGSGFADPDIELYRSPGCGVGNYRLAPPGAGCVRVGCANCGFWLAINEVRFTYTSTSYGVPWVTASTEVVAASYASLGISLYAPDGVSKTWTNKTLEVEWPFPLEFAGVPLTVTLTFSIVEGFTAAMKTSANPFLISKSVSMKSLTATTTFDSGLVATSPSLNTDVTKEMTTQVQQPQAGDYVMFDFLYETTFTLDLTVSLTPKITFGAAVDWTLFLELNVKAGVLPALSTNAIDPSTPLWLTFGNCMAPHLLEIGVYAGLHKVDLSVHFQLIWTFDPRTIRFPSVAVNQSLLSYCYAPLYPTTLAIAVHLSDAGILASSAGHRTLLLASLGAALDLPDLSGAVLAIRNVDVATGIVSITAMLPSSISNAYETPESFMDAVAVREKSALFSTSLYDATSILAGAVCAPGFWGPSCSTLCTSHTCRAVSACTSVGGIPLACSGCHDGYWGATCNQTCTVPSGVHCSTPHCDQTTGGFLDCGGNCDVGYWNITCRARCPTPPQCATGTAVTCDVNSSSVRKCQTCAAGYWGTACQQSCVAPPTCVAGTLLTCDAAQGTPLSCEACAPGYWGPACQRTCALPASCMTATCNGTYGTLETCPRCLVGFWGTRCDNKCSPGNNCEASATVACDVTTGNLALCTSCAVGYTGATCAANAPVAATRPSQASLMLSGLSASDFTPTVQFGFVLAVVQAFTQEGDAIGAADVAILSVTDATNRRRARQLSASSVVVVFTAAVPPSAWAVMQTEPSIMRARLVENHVVANSNQVGALSVAPPPSSGVSLAVIIGASVGGLLVLCIGGYLCWRFKSKFSMGPCCRVRPCARKTSTTTKAVVEPATILESKAAVEPEAVEKPEGTETLAAVDNPVEADKVETDIEHGDEVRPSAPVDPKIEVDATVETAVDKAPSISVDKTP